MECYLHTYNGELFKTKSCSQKNVKHGEVSSGYVSEPPIYIFITRELVTRMTSEAYVYIVDTVDSSPYKAMSRQLSVNVSILYVIKHL